MTTQSTSDRLLTAIKAARLRSEQAHDDMIQAMVAAHAAGETVTTICEAAGVTRPTFYAWAEQAKQSKGVRND